MAHGLDLILDAAARVNDPTIHFLMIGEGAMKKRLEARRGKFGIEERDHVASWSIVTR